MFQLPENTGIVLHSETVVETFIKFSFHDRVESQLQSGKVGDGDPPEQVDGAVNMRPPAVATCQPQDDGGRDLDTSVGGAGQPFLHTARGRSLADPFQQRCVACFNAVVEQFQAGFLQTHQLTLVFAQQVMG